MPLEHVLPSCCEYVAGFRLGKDEPGRFGKAIFPADDILKDALLPDGGTTGASDPQVSVGGFQHLPDVIALPICGEVEPWTKVLTVEDFETETWFRARPESSIATRHEQ